MITLGKKYKDVYHGIQGVAVAHLRHLAGADEVKLEFLDINGDLKSLWFHNALLEELPPETGSKPGFVTID